MLLLFAFGVMNLTWIAGLMLFVLLEKLLPWPVAISRLAGVGALAAGGWLVSHDVVWNRAWAEFTSDIGVRPTIYHSLSMCQKPSGASKP